MMKSVRLSFDVMKDKRTLFNFALFEVRFRVCFGGIFRVIFAF